MRTFLLLTIFFSACRSQIPPSLQQGDAAITVAAAADLRFAFPEMGTVFEQKTKAKVVFNFGSTGNLAKQIEQGAPIDVFAAADEQTVAGLAAKGLLKASTQQVYAVGRVVLASNRRSGLALGELRELLQPQVQRIAMANPTHAPYGLAAKQTLESAGLWEQVRPKLVYGESVSQALQYVQTGNAEAGILALSVARVPEISYVLIDDRLHRPLNQAIAVVTETKREGLARDFINIVTGPEGRPILQKYGYTLPERP